MNKCCVKKKECEHATNYGVCKLSSAYDCKPADLTEYEKWAAELKEKTTKEEQDAI